MQIVTPQSQVYAVNTNFNFNFTVSDDLGLLDTCYYSLDGLTNTTLTCGTNNTANLSDGSHTLFFYANDTGNNLNFTSVTFSINTVSPAVVLNSPTNDTWYQTFVSRLFNFTATDTNGLDTCRLFMDINGTFLTNYTWVKPNNATSNVTYLNLTTEKAYQWNVACNDTLGNTAFALYNLTVGYDNTPPSISSMNITSNEQTQSFVVNFNEISCSSATYTVINSSGGVDNNLQNIAVSCNNPSATFAVTQFDSYYLDVNMTDKVGLNGSKRQLFSAVHSVAGGGGGVGEVEIIIKLPVIALAPINSTKVYTLLELSIMYASINEFAGQRINPRAKPKELASIDFSQEAFLTLTDLQELKELIRVIYALDVPLDDMKLFYKNYKDRNLIQTSASKEEIERLNLFTSIIGTLTLLELNPPSIDFPVIIYEPDGKNITIPYTISSNKKLKLCEITSDTPNLKCTIDEKTQTKVYINYYINDTKFLTKVFSGTITVTTDAPEDKLEQRRLNLAFRVINPGYNNAVYYLGIGFALAIGLFVIARKRKKKLKLGKIFESR